ncbi:hypothetical protein COLO4_05631 [Corchorus olitorius]|uniref:Uncharacterized protein n=1 Tax=Corchorus olitorius TaxID=93759 RepID=A0A1R3KQH4_9ROSI|nr:hypothetical protein COLO4_05631 [Corchorus olitorius]
MKRVAPRVDKRVVKPVRVAPTPLSRKVSLFPQFCSFVIFTLSL